MQHGRQWFSGRSRPRPAVSMPGMSDKTALGDSAGHQRTLNKIGRFLRQAWTWRRFRILQSGCPNNGFALAPLACFSRRRGTFEPPQRQQVKGEALVRKSRHKTGHVRTDSAYSALCGSRRHRISLTFGLVDRSSCFRFPSSPGRNNCLANLPTQMHKFRSSAFSANGWLAISPSLWTAMDDGLKNEDCRELKGIGEACILYERSWKNVLAWALNN